MQDGPLRQSIGNYKGVMLCNRPNDPTNKPQREGPVPFISRVTVKEQLGLNPATKLVLKPPQPKRSLEILSRHKLWLSQLQKQKELDLQKSLESQKLQEKKLKKMKKKYAKPENPKKPEQKLTENNLKSLENENKPKWALTEEEAQKVEEKEQEKEVDELLQFVNELDYDKFISDLEIRQALEIVKERVEEIKKDKEWKQKIAEKYNEENVSQKSKGSVKEMTEKAKGDVADAKKDKWDNSVLDI